MASTIELYHASRRSDEEGVNSQDGDQEDCWVDAIQQPGDFPQFVVAKLLHW